MVAVKLQGRLGNQLFQYAFIYSISRKLKTRFYLDKSIEPFLLPKYFKINSDSFYLLDHYLFSISGYKHLFKYHLKRYFYASLKKAVILKQVQFSNDAFPEDQLKNISNHTLYEGFFHSELFFADSVQDIKNLFSIKDSFKKTFEDIIRMFPASVKFITIHLRRGDYVALDLSLPLTYYHSAVKLTNMPQSYFIIISDDPEFAEKEFHYLTNKYVSHHSEIIDLQFLMVADTCILSNSSFSWWGAYLNKKHPRVIVPKYWSGYSQHQEFPTQSILPNWEQLDIYTTSHE